MSEADPQANQEHRAAAVQAPVPGAPEPARLRRRPFGYRRADVDEALATRDSQLAELRQDIAALWLAFAQHDRLIRELGGAGATPPAPPAPQAERSPGGGDAADGVEAVGRQLSDLDEALAAIEIATQTLERAYSDEVAGSSPATGVEGSGSENPSEQGGGGSAQ